MKTALGTVVYDTAYTFHEDFIHAVNRQNTMDFDLLLLNDNLNNECCQSLNDGLRRPVNWVKHQKNKTIAECKIKLIKSAKENDYDLLVLGDFDDTFSENRISCCIMNYENDYCFFYNELFYMDQDIHFFRTLPSVVEKIDPILECNFLGFSNTALNMNKIDDSLLAGLCTMQTTAFDWMVFSLLLLQGHKGKKIDGCKTFYRIYENNTAGEAVISIEGLKKEIDIKAAHYAKLIELDPRYSDLYKFYTDLDSSEIDFLLKHANRNNRYWWGLLNKDAVLRDGNL